MLHFKHLRLWRPELLTLYTVFLEREDVGMSAALTQYLPASRWISGYYHRVLACTCGIRCLPGNKVDSKTGSPSSMPSMEEETNNVLKDLAVTIPIRLASPLHQPP
jgi:hypothetical protein